MKKSSLLLVSLALLLTTFLAACGGSGNGGNSGNNGNTASPSPSGSAEATASPTPEAEPVNLRVFSTFGGTDAARDAFQGLLDEFTAANPNVKIENDVMSANDDGFRTKVNTDMNSGNEPDLLFYFVGADAEGFVNAGKVVPLNDLLEADPEWKNGFSPSALESVRQADGNIYAAPLTGYYEGLFVNKALFEKYSLELPTDYDKLKKAVETFAANGVIPLAGPFDQSHYIIEHFILAAAGPEGQKKGLIDGVDPNWEKGLAAIKELGELGAFPKDAATIDLSMASNYYSEGLAAMILEGSWAIGGWADEVKNNTTVVPFPAIPGGAGSGNDVVGGFGSGFYLSKATYDNAAKKDTAIALMKFLTSPESIQKIAQANGGTPAADVKIEGLPQAAVDGFAMVAKSASITSPIDSKVAPETFSSIRASIQPIVEGKKTPADALKEAHETEVAAKK
ncbi:ABC transporter substrate-binding protein [Paenibacillus thailandensis]|uniref:ABC transporter substrate-binding protein n=1 Tax=Paenibacillus thailandensis TaxID=393250 RepID=A0ABW5QW39_9BACL